MRSVRVRFITWIHRRLYHSCSKHLSSPTSKKTSPTIHHNKGYSLYPYSCWVEKNVGKSIGAQRLQARNSNVPTPPLVQDLVNKAATRVLVLAELGSTLCEAFDSLPTTTNQTVTFFQFVYVYDSSRDMASLLYLNTTFHPQDWSSLCTTGKPTVLFYSFTRN